MPLLDTEMAASGADGSAPPAPDGGGGEAEHQQGQGHAPRSLLTNDMFRAHRAARQKDEVTTEYAISKKDSARWAPVPSKPNVTYIGYDLATKKCTAPCSIPGCSICRRSSI